MDKVILLSGTTRGGTLEGIARSFAAVLNELNIELVEISLLNMDAVLQMLKAGGLEQIRFVMSWAGMGMDISLTQEDGRRLNVWHELGIPFITFHGDSPSYFFDRHIVRSPNFTSLYGFSEHCELRRRLPGIHGPIGDAPAIPLDELPLDQVDFQTKKDGTLLFLKNGKDPLSIRRSWQPCVSPPVFRALCELADELGNHLDSAAGNQIDDLVMKYFADRQFDLEHLTNLRLFFIAQLDDYLRALKTTRIARVLMDFPVQIRGNNWDHLDFSGKKATYIDDCNYIDSIGLIRRSLGTIDMSANTASLPHDRVMRAYGSHTLCLTNAGQSFTKTLPFCNELTYDFEEENLRCKVAQLLANKGAAVEMGVAVAEAFKASNPPTRSLERILDYAAFTRLNQTKQRLSPMQDFFIWPPTLI